MSDPQPTPEPKPEPDPKPTPEPKPDPRPEITLTPEQQAEVDRRIAAARRQAEADAKKKVEAEIAAKADEERAKREQDEAVKRGEFETVRKDLEAKVTDLTQTNTALAEQVAAYEKRDRARIETGVKDLPDDLKVFDPGADAPLPSRLDWFEKAQKIAAERATDPVPGVKRAPDPLRGDPKRDEEARREQAKLARAF